MVEVAVKVLSEFDKESCNALWREARVMQEYKHENVVKFYGIANDFKPYHLVLELVSGGSVDNYLKKDPTMCIKRRTNILLEAARGLEYLHANLCIHRDVAARNLLIDKVVKVADFGLTRRSKKYHIDVDKPLNLRWIAPDAIAKSSVDKATDVYAFGVTMFEVFIVPYEIPYSNWTPEQVNKKVLEGTYRLPPPPLLKTKCKDLAQVMKDCLAEPKIRPTFKQIVAYIQTQVIIMDKEMGKWDAPIKVETYRKKKKKRDDDEGGDEED